MPVFATRTSTNFGALTKQVGRHEDDHRRSAQVNSVVVSDMVLRFLKGDRVASGRYIVVVHATDGKIDSHRDYRNPLAMIPSTEAAQGV